MTLKAETLGNLLSNFDSELSETLINIAALDNERANLVANAERLRIVLNQMGGYIPSKGGN